MWTPMAAAAAAGMHQRTVRRRRMAPLALSLLLLLLLLLLLALLASRLGKGRQWIRPHVLRWRRRLRCRQQWGRSCLAHRCRPRLPQPLLRLGS